MTDYNSQQPLNLTQHEYSSRKQDDIIYTVMCNTTLSPHLECWKKDVLQQYFSSSHRIKFAQEVNS